MSAMASGSSRSPAQAATCWTISRAVNVGVWAVSPAGPVSRSARLAMSAGVGGSMVRSMRAPSVRTCPGVHPASVSRACWAARTWPSARIFFGALEPRCAAALVAPEAVNPSAMSAANSSLISPVRVENASTRPRGMLASSATPLRTGPQRSPRRRDSSWRSAAAPR